jgi:hypothetical protein
MAGDIDTHVKICPTPKALARFPSVDGVLTGSTIEFDIEYSKKVQKLHEHVLRDLGQYFANETKLSNKQKPTKRPVRKYPSSQFQGLIRLLDARFNQHELPKQFVKYFSEMFVAEAEKFKTQISSSNNEQNDVEYDRPSVETFVSNLSTILMDRLHKIDIDTELSFSSSSSSLLSSSSSSSLSSSVSCLPSISKIQPQISYREGVFHQTQYDQHQSPNLPPNQEQHQHHLRRSFHHQQHSNTFFTPYVSLINTDYEDDFCVVERTPNSKTAVIVLKRTPPPSQSNQEYQYNTPDLNEHSLTRHTGHQLRQNLNSNRSQNHNVQSISISSRQVDLYRSTPGTGTPLGRLQEESELDRGDFEDAQIQQPAIEKRLQRRDLIKLAKDNQHEPKVILNVNNNVANGKSNHSNDSNHHHHHHHHNHIHHSHNNSNPIHPQNRTLRPHHQQYSMKPVNNTQAQNRMTTTLMTRTTTTIIRTDSNPHTPTQNQHDNGYNPSDDQYLRESIILRGSIKEFSDCYFDIVTDAAVTPIMVDLDHLVDDDIDVDNGNNNCNNHHINNNNNNHINNNNNINVGVEIGVQIVPSVESPQHQLYANRPRSSHFYQPHTLNAEVGSRLRESTRIFIRDNEQLSTNHIDSDHNVPFDNNNNHFGNNHHANNNNNLVNHNFNNNSNHHHNIPHQSGPTRQNIRNRTNINPAKSTQPSPRG